MASSTHRRDRSPRDHYAEVTDKIIAALEAGTPPWRQPWDNDKAGGPLMPQNATTGARYHGINVLTLAMSPLAFASGDPRWATYKQAAAQGWQVRAGERGSTAYFFKRLEVPGRESEAGTGDDANPRRIPLLRAFTLFHASQIDGLPPFVVPTLAEAPWRAPDAVDIIVQNSGAVIHIGGDKAFYSPATDHIQIPRRESFESDAAFDSVRIHELAHWTSGSERLNRELKNSFGSHDYAREELRAEISSCLVCAELNVEDYDFSNNASYLKMWLDRLRSDRKEIFRAAADAQRIADYLLAFHPDWKARIDGRTEAATEDDSARTEENTAADFAEAA